MLSEEIIDPKAFAEEKMNGPDKALGLLWQDFCHMLQLHRQGADRESLPIDLLALCYRTLSYQEGLGVELRSRLERVENALGLAMDQTETPDNG